MMTEEVRNNKTIYLSNVVIAKVEIQEDVGDEACQVYHQYWYNLKIGR